MDSTFEIVWVTLLLAPILAVIAFAAFRRNQTRTRLAAISAILVAIVIGSIAVGFVFSMTLANAIVIALAYTAYCFLAVSAWQIPQVLARVVALFVASVPIAVGYFLSSAGLFALAVMTGDLSAKAERTEQLENGLICRVTMWGGAGIGSGYTVGLYRIWKSVPIERRVAVLAVNQEAGEPDATCADAMKQYRG